MSRVQASDTIGNLDACLARADYGRGLTRELLMQSPSDVPYSTPLLDAVCLFEQLRIGYALSGGLAAMYYGRPRFTEDVDFVAVAAHQQILEQNPQAMRQFRFDPACTWKLYHESGVEIDLWKDEFSGDIVSRAVPATLAGRTVNVAEVHDLIAMKLRAGRLQDDSDIAEILKRQQIDSAVVRSRVTEKQFAHFLEVQARAARETES